MRESISELRFSSQTQEWINSIPALLQYLKKNKTKKPHSSQAGSDAATPFPYLNHLNGFLLLSNSYVHIGILHLYTTFSEHSHTHSLINFKKIDITGNYYTTLEMGEAQGS